MDIIDPSDRYKGIKKSEELKMVKTLRIIARKSLLSLLQVKEAFAELKGISYTLRTLDTYGDLHRKISLMDAIPQDFFTRELDYYLKNGEADVSVNSAKDLPYPLPPELELYALYKSKDKTDSLVSRGNLTLAQLPAGAKVGTSSPLRKKNLQTLRPDLTVVPIRGNIEERVALVDKGDIDALIVATCALERLGLADRIAERLPFTTHPLQGNLAVIGPKGHPAIKEIFAPLDISRSFGKVTLVGFGPGNPDFLTIAGRKALEKADVIFYDALVDEAFVLEHFKAEKIYVGKREGKHSLSQDEINELMYRAAFKGQQVVRLKGGDPMIFAHGREEIDFLQSRFVNVEVVPGITAAVAMSALTHIPLTHRGVASSVAFVTGHSSSVLNETAELPSADTLVYYMGGGHLAEIARRLIAQGRKASTSVALVCNVSRENQQTFFSTLNELRFSVMKYPTPILIVIGETVAFELPFQPVSKVLATGTTVGKPVSGREVIVHTPLIEIHKNTAEADTLKTVLRQRLKEVDWIVFTSRYGVNYFFEWLKDAELDMRNLLHTKLASVGKTTTAALKNYCFSPDIESNTESAEGLLLYFSQQHSGKKLTYLLPRSNKGLPQLSVGLQKLGHEVIDLPVYINTDNEEAKKVSLDEVSKILFGSPSGVQAFEKLYGHLPEGKLLIARGKTTENELKKGLDSIK